MVVVVLLLLLLLLLLLILFNLLNIFSLTDIMSPINPGILMHAVGSLFASLLDVF